MKEEIVKYATAKLAKEKGFDIECSIYYAENGKLYTRLGLSAEGIKVAKTVKAPTQSLLQRWLREIYNIDLWFGELDSPNKYHVEDIVRRNTVIGSVFGGSKSYEEALERGLVEALNLI